MGYFSNMTIDMKFEDYEDFSYPSPEKELLRRLNDLKERMEELNLAGCPFGSGFIYTEDDIRYALPDDLDDIYKVERAIEIAEDDLLEKYGINVGEDMNDIENKYDQTILIDFSIPSMAFVPIAA